MASKLEKMVFNKNFLCRKYTTPNRPHSHTVWELVLFEKGETSNFVNDTEFVAKPGDVFLIGPPHTHAIVFRTTPHLHRDLYYKDEEVRAVCAMFSGDLYEKICNGIFNFHISSDAFQAIIRQADKLDSLSVIAGKEETAQDKEGLANNKELRAVSFSLLHFIIGLYRTKMLIAAPAYPKWMLDILQLLNSPDAFTKSVDDIISETYYSHATVSNAFRKYLGVTISDYLIDLRLEHAAELLANTSMSALEVCSAVGYDSFSYFIKQFKKKYGVTPHKYRSNTAKN